ncbi:uncharacterized membrane protein YhaH (DUF805 family) [Devosia sp. UYZn731]|uniref:DUF805 domain-containing protein n=1 Tax=Devosia sp. UYZn731 TaxID=3156345 RepID=UPI003393E0DC
MNAYADAMRRYFDLRSRSTRSQFWLFYLVYLVIFMLAAGIDGAMGHLKGNGPAFVIAIVHLFHIIPSIAVSVRRLHDIDRTGWWLLLAFIPIIGTIVLLVWSTTPSTPGANRFGPKASGSTKEAVAEPPLARQSSVVPDLDRLEKLAALKASGAIDDTEYQMMKSNIISGGSAK